MRGLLKFNEPLAMHTSWHIGGPADKYFRPADTKDLAEFLKTSVKDNEPITWLGLGSNVLISDSGIRGVVIHTLAQAGAGAITVSEPESNTEKVLIWVDAGVTCAKLAKYCAKEGLLGGEFFAGIPGTLGGALAMNAGAWGGETWRLVKQVEVINRYGEQTIRSSNMYKIQYRSVERIRDNFQNNVPEKLHEEWFIAGCFEFERGDSAIATRKVKALLQERTAKQPIGVFSCGSVFKNPEGNHAGKLIEASQLKGFTIGGAQISPKHANFILNLGYAKAQDVLALIKHIQAVVLKDHQICLEPEVRILGF
ncbi:MAG TPA: UDP-N-acetylmuramate dehydrogenase [Gammaproteobacteria bacterium]|nr:UDP-N-acetylmuramate dehydrogenase [Gammaproteobacteria bacterium]HRA42205.1 UDP-N-acetylmuramate dehydrogenase [Gammaproteobacteria bacterium]